jgi:Tol biopolymer transport system component
VENALLTGPRSLAFGAAMASFLLMVGNSARPQVASAQSGQRARLVWETEPGFDPGESSPSPDGRYIAFSDWSTGDLGVRDLNVGISRRLTNEGYNKGYAEGTVMSPDDSQIAYKWDDAKDSYQLRIVATAGGPPKTVLRITGPGEYFAPAGWTPDGKRLLVIHGLSDHTTQLALLSLADKSLRPIKSFSWQRIEARLSPDGRYAAYSVTVSVRVTPEIFSSSLRTAPVRRLLSRIPPMTPDQSGRLTDRGCCS